MSIWGWLKNRVNPIPTTRSGRSCTTLDTDAPRRKAKSLKFPPTVSVLVNIEIFVQRELDAPDSRALGNDISMASVLLSTCATTMSLNSSNEAMMHDDHFVPAHGTANIPSSHHYTAVSVNSVAPVTRTYIRTVSLVRAGSLVGRSVPSAMVSLASSNFSFKSSPRPFASSMPSHRLRSSRLANVGVWSYRSATFSVRRYLAASRSPSAASPRTPRGNSRVGEGRGRGGGKGGGGTSRRCVISRPIVLRFSPVLPWIQIDAVIGFDIPREGSSQDGCLITAHREQRDLQFHVAEP